MTSSLQQSIARQSVIAGLAALLGGMLYGAQILDGTWGNPQLMLAAHTQFELNGMLQVLGGLILAQPQLCKMTSKMGLRVFQAANVWAVPVVLGAEVWGARAGVSWPRLLKQAGLPPADTQLYTIYSFLHFLPGGLLVVGYALLLWACITSGGEGKKVKTKVKAS